MVHCIGGIEDDGPGGSIALRTVSAVYHSVFCLERN